MAEFLISSTSTAARTDSPYILEVEHISKGFPGQRQLVLQEVAFRLPQGDILGIVGPSGCGKTTLLRTIAGFEQPCPAPDLAGLGVLPRALARPHARGAG